MSPSYRVASVLLATFVAAIDELHASPPPNDDIANAIPIALTADIAVVDWIQATAMAGDPVNACSGGRFGFGKNVWYRHTTGNDTEYLNVIFSGTSPASGVAVYADEDGSLRNIAGGCVLGGFYPARLVGARLLPQQSYLIEISLTDPSTIVHFYASPLYRVSKTTDTADGACNTDCSLREAVSASNQAPGAILLEVPGTYSLDRLGGDENANATGDLDFTAGAAVYGLGAASTVIDGRGMDRIVDTHVANKVETLTIADLQIQNGQPHDGTGDAPVRNFGGGIRNVDNDFAGLLQLYVVRARFVFNGADYGGAMATRGYASIVDSEFLLNQATLDLGGGIASLNQPFSDRPIRIDRSTFTSNRGVRGGAIGGDSYDVNLSTFSDNRADRGGALMQEGEGIGRVRSSTIVGNRATVRGGGISVELTGGYLDLANSLVAGNLLVAGAADDCYDADGSHAFHSVHSRYSLWGAAGNCVIDASDRTSPNNAVAPLGNYGGPTPTLPPVAGSRAINGADPGGCSDTGSQTFATDQRGAGYVRVDAHRCDIGAIETDVFFADGFEAT